MVKTRHVMISRTWFPLAEKEEATISICFFVFFCHLNSWHGVCDRYKMKTINLKKKKMVNIQKQNKIFICFMQQPSINIYIFFMFSDYFSFDVLIFLK